MAKSYQTQASANCNINHLRQNAKPAICASSDRPHHYRIHRFFFCKYYCAGSSKLWYKFIIWILRQPTIWCKWVFSDMITNQVKETLSHQWVTLTVGPDSSSVIWNSAYLAKPSAVLISFRVYTFNRFSYHYKTSCTYFSRSVQHVQW